MKNWFLGKFLAFIGRKFDGYKTKIGAGGGIVLGVLGLVKCMFPDQLPALPDIGVEASLGLISAGMAALGIGGKLEKQKAATIEQTTAIAAQTEAVKAVAAAPAISINASGPSLEEVMTEVQKRIKESRSGVL